MNPSERIQVWDPLIRLFHWLLVVSFCVAWFTRESDYELHIITGYAVLGLVVVRILWGFIGTRHARFSDFMKSPRELLIYTLSLHKRQAKHYLGHNPAGGVMILVMLLALLILTISGIALDGAENWSGPLADMGLFRYKETIHRLHDWSTNTMLVLIPLHLLGVVHASLLQRENLVKSMFSGYKKPSNESATH